MDFDADLHAVVGAKASDFVQRLADLFDGLFHRAFFGQAVGADFHAAAADVLAQFDELLGFLDVFLQLLWIDGVVFTGAAQTDQFHIAVRKTFTNRGTLLGVCRDFNSVFMRAPQFHAGEPGGLTVFNHRRQIPVLAPVVGYQAQFQTFARGSSGRSRGCAEGRQGGN